MHFSLIVPVHDEQATITEDVWLLTQRAAQVSADWELVVVDRGSRDRTPEILERMRSREPRLILICHARSRGLGEAWRSALMRARGEVLAVLDRPGEWDLSKLPEMVAALERCDLWAGYHRRGKPTPGRRRAAWALQLMLGLDPRLMDGGIFLLRRSLLGTVGLEEKGAMVAWELAARTRRAGRELELGPVPFFERAGTLSAPAPSWMDFWRLARQVKCPAAPLFSPGHEASTTRLRLEFLHNATGRGEGDLALER